MFFFLSLSQRVGYWSVFYTNINNMVTLLFVVTCEMLTAVARDQRWPNVVAGISARLFKICFCFVLLHNKSLTDRSLEILGKQNSLTPKGTIIKLSSGLDLLNYVH